MKKIYFLEKHPVKIGDVVEYKRFRATVTEELIRFNPELFTVENPMKELLDKAKRDYPIGTVFDNGSGMQKVTKDNYEWFSIHKQVLVTTDKYFGGGTIYSSDKGWAEILPLKFITEDGVSIYGDMKTYAICRDELILDLPSVYGGNSPTLIYFYHKENALAYIEKHKEKTLEDYEQMLFKKDNSMTFSPKSAYFTVYGWIKDNEPKLYYTKILQLIADDLNDGWKPNFSDDKSKWYIREDNTDWTVQRNRGTVLFKTKKLAEKAKDILGDKVKYLFN